ncbi:MAG: DUF3857 domain-containing protein [Chitinivibrionales bacterium]|nr:DUF3857 domain-containing protein [Chitinivibrionales bacterium]
MRTAHRTTAQGHGARTRAGISMLALLACTCLNPYTVQIDSLHKEFGLRSLPVQSDFPEDDAVILVESTELELPDFHSTSVAQLKRYRKAIRVFRPSERFTDVRLRFPATSQVTYISARTITSAGEVIELSHDEFHRITATSEAGGPRSGLKAIGFSFHSVDSGSVLEYQYQVLSSTPTPVGRWDMQHEIPAMRLRYSFQVPAHLVTPDHEGEYKPPITFRTYNHDRDILPVERRVDEHTMGYVFETVNVPERRDQPVFLRYRRSFRDTVIVSFNKKVYSVLSNPTSTRSKVKSPVTFECRNTSLAGEHRLLTDLVCEQREIPPGEYEAFRRNVLDALHVREGYVVVRYL